MLQRVMTLFNVTLTATACKGVFRWTSLNRSDLFISKATPPENDDNLKLVKNVSCNPNRAGLYCLKSRASSSKLAWKPRKFHLTKECSIASVRWDQWWVHLITGQGRILVGKDQIPLRLLQSVWIYWFGWSSTSTRTLPTLTAVGELLDEDEPSFEDTVFKGPSEPLGAVFKGPSEPLGAVFTGPADPLGAVFKGPAEPLGAVLEGTAEPLEAVLEGLAEPLEAVLEGLAEPWAVSDFFAGSHGTGASANARLDLLEEAWVLANTDPGPPEEHIEDRTVLRGCSRKTHISDVGHSTVFISFLVEAATA